MDPYGRKNGYSQRGSVGHQSNKYRQPGAYDTSHITWYQYEIKTRN